MLTAKEIIDVYISFFEKRGHVPISNSPLVPENDPTTLFISSGMQPLVPYLLGEDHPLGKRLVNIQNCFRAVDIEQIGDNRHTTFFRMLGNWSLGDYFKENQLRWFWEFLTKELGLKPEKLYITVFKGNDSISYDKESYDIWKNIFINQTHIADYRNRIIPYGVDENWWSRGGTPNNMPVGEIGGADSEVFYDFGKELGLHEKSAYKNTDCHPNCECGRFLEIGNSVFMSYKKKPDRTFGHLPRKNVDFGGGLERLLAAVENKHDIFQTSLFLPIIRIIEQETRKDYKEHAAKMRIIADHFSAACFIINANIKPSNKDQGYILRRLIRRGLDNFYALAGKEITPLLEEITAQHKSTDPNLTVRFEAIKNTIFQEEQGYKETRAKAQKFIQKKYHEIPDELKGVVGITADEAFLLYTTHGLSPTQIESLGYSFDKQEFARKLEEHQNLSRKGARHKFAGGLADHQEKTIMGHTATHLLHQALRDLLGNNVRQTGSNITSERLRFDFNFDRNLTPDEIKQLEETVNEEVRKNLPVHYEIMPLEKAKKIGAIGLFDEKYSDKVKVYFIGDYSKEFCGGPHVVFTSQIKSFKIKKQENIGKGFRRLYAEVGN